MTKRPLVCLSSLALIAVIETGVSPAIAGPNDEQAKQLAEQALFEDYLNLNFESAKTKLILAADLCREGCSADVRARVLRDLGVVYVAGLKDRKEGVSTFIKALQAYPDLKLDPDLSNAEIVSAFEEAQGLAASGATEAPDEEEPKAPKRKNKGVSHTPIRASTINTPLPIFIRVDEDELEAEVKKAKVFFRGFGMARFKEEPMGEIDDGLWGIELGCNAVGASGGKFEYYIVVIDDDDFEAATIGSDTKPLVVQLVDQANPPPEPLPGTEAPQQCEMPEGSGDVGAGLAMDDCPPDFPGCGPTDELVEDDAAPEPGGYAKHWFSISFQQDFLLMAATSDACNLSAPSNYSCYYEDDTYRDPWANEWIADPFVNGVLSRPSDRTAGDSGSVGGGLAMGTQRLLLGYEFAVTPNILIGGKVGFAFGGGPTRSATRTLWVDPQQLDGPSFVPIHAEARGSYWFGENVLIDQFVRPYVVLSMGLAQVDASVSTQVVDRYVADPSYTPHCQDAVAGSCIENVSVWQKSGTAFGSLGAGAVLAFGSNHGLSLEARFMQLFPATGSAVGGQAGYVVGF